MSLVHVFKTVAEAQAWFATRTVQNDALYVIARRLYTGEVGATGVTGLPGLRDVLAGASVTNAGVLNLPSGGAFQVNSVQVVNGRKTGWTADTGTDNRAAVATYTGGTAAAAYDQTEITGIKNALQAVSQQMKALKADLTSHGLIGT